MVVRGHRRQVLLFLVAVLLPCALLVVLGVRMVAQERELAEKRLADERRSLTAQLRRELSGRLDRIALREATALMANPGTSLLRTYQDPAVVFVAQVSGEGLVLPWEADPRPSRFRGLLAQGAFGQLVVQGEAAEMGSRDPEGAIRIYTRAVEAAVDPGQVAYARLLRARASRAAGLTGEAYGDDQAVLRTDLDLVDEYGVPLALYAATTLLDDDGNRTVIEERVRAVLEDPRWVPPVALYLLRDLTAGLASTDDAGADEVVSGLDSAVEARIAAAEQAMAIRRDFPRLGLGLAPAAHPNGEAPWVCYGSPPWLVGRAALLSGGDEVVVAVRADTLFAAVQGTVGDGSGATGELAVASGPEDRGELLGSSFPGLVVRFASEAPTGAFPWGARGWFYLVAVLFVLSVTLFGAYVVSRDVRRELRLADTRSRFVSAVSHELKTPLTAIRMFAEALQLGESPDPEMLKEYLETIVHESERLTRLLNNVLDFSKIERGKKDYRRTPCDLADIVGAAARAMQYPLEQQRFNLSLEIQEELPEADVDPDAVEQAILNLLSNAMKYSADSRAIDLRLMREDGQAVIEVSDQGIGIAPEEQRKIFQQFYRVPSEENEGVPGTGLGLTLVRHIAEGHGGRVTVESVPGQGSTFTIHLPLEAERS